MQRIGVDIPRASLANWMIRLGALIQQLVKSFEQSRQSPYLYAASICITEYGPDASYTQRLFDLAIEQADLREDEHIQRLHIEIDPNSGYAPDAIRLTSSTHICRPPRRPTTIASDAAQQSF